MDTLKIDQTLYMEVCKRNKPIEIKEVTIEKIGNKYFYLNGYYDKCPVDKNTLKHTNKDYSQCNFQLYLTKQEILDRQEKDKIQTLLRDTFDFWKSRKEFSLEQLREVVKILNLEL